MTEQDITAKVHEIWDHINGMFNLKNKSMPSIGFFHKSTVAGKAIYDDHRVEFNLILAADNSDKFEQTIAHELSHLVTKELYPDAKQHHGPEFRQVMNTLGYDGNTYHTYDTSKVANHRLKTRFEYVCTSCPNTFSIAKPTHTKIQTGIIYLCSCGSGIRFTGKEFQFV